MVLRLSVLLALPAIASAGTIDAPVVGGSTAPQGKWPDAVAVLGTSGSCTGTLIAPDVVLTAGHCAEIKPVEVIANTTDYTDADGVLVDVQSTTAYPDWQHTYDVSVIVLAKPIPGVTPRKVGTGCTLDELRSAMSVHLVGYGLTAEDGTGNNTLLNEAMAPVVDPDCSGGRGCHAKVAPGGEFVAGGDGTDSCFGDSGGPVYFDTPRGTVVIGAVSRGIDGAAMPCGGGGIYVRTDKVVSWIEETTGRTIAKDECSGSDSADSYGEVATGGCSTGRGGAGLGIGLALLAVRRSGRPGAAPRRAS
jgi:secreted trypsin-like serine protease